MAMVFMPILLCRLLEFTSKMILTINFKYLFLFIFCFIIFTVIGTISHEFGHIIVAKNLGYKTKLHYGSMSFKEQNNLENQKIIELFKKNEIAIKNNIDFDDKKQFEKLVMNQKNNSLLIDLGGPIQTVFTGLFGFIFLIFRLKYNKYKFSNFDWFLVFLSLFWLRQVFNPIISISRRFIRGKGNYFGRSDETQISQFFELPKGTLDIILGFIGLLICSYVILVLIPKENRFTFLISGLIGGSLGFYIWMYKIGPILLP